MTFPPPEIPYLPAGYREVEVQGALVFQVTAMPGHLVALAAVIQVDGQDTLLRFQLPKHNRSVRRIYVRGGMRGVPKEVETLNITGLVALNLTGTIIGEDRIREDLETKPVAAYVLANVVATGVEG